MPERNYTVQTRISRPVSDVYQAIVDNQILCRYFTDRSSGDLRAGDTVVWHWNDWGDHPVDVKETLIDERIVLELDSHQWKKTEQDGYPVTVTFELESLDEHSTMLCISESGWPTDQDGLKGSHDNCSGWTHMAMCLKGFLEHDLDLRH